MTAPPVRAGSTQRRIFRRVLWLLAVGMMGPFGLVAWLQGLDRSERERHALAERTLLCRLVAERVGALLASGLRELEQAAALLERPEAHGLAGSGPSQVAARMAVREVVLRHTLFSGALVLGPEGQVLAEEPDSGAAQGARLGLAELRERAAAARGPAFADLASGRAEVYAIVPARAFGGALAGVIVGVIDLGGPHLADALKNVKAGAGERLDLVDARGRILASTSPDRWLHQSEQAGLTGQLLEAQSRARFGDGRARLGPDDASELPDERRGSPAGDGSFAEAGVAGGLFAFAPVPHAGWGVAVWQPEASALAQSGAIARDVLAVGLLAFALALVFAWGAGRSVTRPLETLTGEAQRLAAGSLDQPLPALPDDEVGRLGEALEAMRVALRDSLAGVASANALLEQRVADRTLALVEANRSLEALNLHLRESEEVVHQLLSQVISAQEDERRRVARELHDDTSSSLAALVLQLHGAAAAAEPGPRREQLEGVQALAVHTLEEVHRMIRALRPSVLDDLGLRSAIAWTGEQLGKQGVAVRCEFSGLGQRLSPLVETVVFRVVQEALTNIGKHAHAESVLIQATQAEGRLAVEIEDDGRGFDAAALARPGSDGRGWGLLGMRERVQMLGGALQLDSTPGKGTRLLLTLPLPPAIPTIQGPPPEQPGRPQRLEASDG